MKHVLPYKVLTYICDFNIIKKKFLQGNLYWILPYLSIRYNVVNFIYRPFNVDIDSDVAMHKIYNTFRLYLEP